MKALVKHLRLLPAVLLVGTGLLAVKSFGLAQTARAESAPAQERQAPAPEQSAANDPAEESSDETSAAEVDVLTGLSSRRQELDKRATDLDMRENLIAAAEKRVDGRIAALRQLQTEIEGMLGQRDEAEQKQIAALVKTYSSMKPKDAARIFNSLDEKVLLAVAEEMKPDVLGAILSGMQPAEAQKLTVKLANRFKLPEAQAQEAPAQQQLASLQPPAATGTAPAATPPATSTAAPPAPTAVAPPPATQEAAKPDAKTDSKPETPKKAGG